MGKIFVILETSVAFVENPTVKSKKKRPCGKDSLWIREESIVVQTGDSNCLHYCTGTVPDLSFHNKNRLCSLHACLPSLLRVILCPNPFRWTALQHGTRRGHGGCHNGETRGVARVDARDKTHPVDGCKMTRRCRSSCSQCHDVAEKVVFTASSGKMLSAPTTEHDAVIFLL